MKKNRVLRALLSALMMPLMLGGCQTETPAIPEKEPESTAAAESTAETVEKNGDIVILYTSDIHCGLRQGFGVIGLHQIRRTMEAAGTTTLLVDDGDAIQGDVIGTLTKGEAIITIMNDLRYDVAIPGNHEFDYGMEYFFSAVEKAEFPYISCNFNKEGETVLEPYVIKEAAGKKIAFIGVTTPETLVSSSPVNFQDENGNYIYGFLQDDDGSLLIGEIQKNVDEVREKGADYVVVMAHMGNGEADAPYNFQTIIENTTGIDVILDGHSHDTDQVTMNDKEGHPVIRSACGTKLQAIGYMKISGSDGSVSCGIYTWNNETPVFELLGIHNEMDEPTAKLYADLADTMNIPIGTSKVDLTIYDPVKKKSDGSPERIVRSRETNLADLTADAFRYQTGAEACLLNGGNVRDSISAGDITYGDIIRVLPFNGEVCVSALSGRQILDALEWGVRQLPGENGGFPQVSGIAYEVHADIPSSCVTDLNGMFGGVTGEYRVKNVTVNGEPLDPERKYNVAGTSYLLKQAGDGYSMFSPEDVVLDAIQLDSQTFIDYVKDTLNGEITDTYSDPYGDGRITILGLEE